MLILVRHGESVLNKENRLVGHLDPQLTELGERQARAAGTLLDAVSELRTSPLARTRATAGLLGTNHEAVVEPRMIELDYGELDGMPLGEVDPELWRRWMTDAAFAPAQGESLSALGARVGDVMEELFEADGVGARSREGDVVIVSHVSPIKAAVAWALGTGDLTAWRLRLSTGSVTRIAMGPAGPQLLSFNEVPALD
jgi:broad specificity phosphatase PhoE